MSVYSYDKAGTVAGKRMCKTKVKVLGRFLLSPEEEFNAMVARQLIDKAKGRQVSIGTVLRVFEMGVQFGDDATFAIMPVEFIKYHRLSDMIVLTNEPTILSMCIKDYDQRNIILVQFKDKVSLKVVADVVQKRRSALLENFARMQSTNDQAASRQRPVSPTAAGNQIEATNPVANDATQDHVDGKEELQIDSYEQGIIENRVSDSASRTQATGLGIHENPNHDFLLRRQLGESELQLQTSLQHSQQDPQSSSVRHQIYVGEGTEESQHDPMAGQSHPFQPQQQRQSNTLQEQDHQAADRHQYTDNELRNPLGPLNWSQPPPQQSFLLSVEHQLSNSSSGQQKSEGRPLKVDALQPLPQQTGTTKLPRHDYQGFLAHHNPSTETAIERTTSLPAGHNGQQMSNDASQQFDRRLPRTPVENKGEFRNRHFSGQVRPIARVTDSANLSDFGNGWWADQGYYYRRNRIFMTARKS